MCRWHKLAAKDAATDPITGEFNPAKYAIALTAMGLYRVEQKQWGLDKLFEIDGFNPEEILTQSAQSAYHNTPMAGRDKGDVQNSLNNNINILRDALNKLADTHETCTVSGLHIPKGVTKEGYKATCCAPANPRDNGPFLDAAVVYLAKGYDNSDRSYASRSLELISAEDHAALMHDKTVAEHDRPYISALKNLRRLTEEFLAMPDVQGALYGAFYDSISYIFDTAEYDLEHSLGLTGKSECIMCEGSKGRKTTTKVTADESQKPSKEQGKASRLFNQVSQYVPQKLKDVFKVATSCAGNIIIPHVPCFGLMTLASSSALAAAYVSNIWLVGATSIAAATGGYISWRHSRFEKASKFEHGVMVAGPALAAGLMITMHLPGGGLHDHHNMQHDEHKHHRHETIQSSENHQTNWKQSDPEGWEAAQSWFKTLNADEERKVIDNAAQWNMPLHDAIYHSHLMCSAPPTKTQSLTL